MKQVDRIRAMEELMNECQEEVSRYVEALKRFEEVQAKVRKLSAYYGSANWYLDREADEQGVAYVCHTLRRIGDAAGIVAS